MDINGTGFSYDINDYFEFQESDTNQYKIEVLKRASTRIKEEAKNTEFLTLETKKSMDAAKSKLRISEACLEASKILHEQALTQYLESYKYLYNCSTLGSLRDGHQMPTHIHNEATLLSSDEKLPVLLKDFKKDTQRFQACKAAYQAAQEIHGHMRMALKKIKISCEVVEAELDRLETLTQKTVI